ncbi:DNA/RNA non-specific endonuclease [Oceanispirochaeta sp.]|jgi:endonuclease G|uniref:DNA/RNA non-specific endonuclease n=1 Tax=Oceanispirochaeta sp. TaxID=2035350 RepID=UPI00260A19C3|nr:DNA/RNA non-specific endonuclease [Oceanispirochaeta sp.]MDA3956859.1 DNA/RNA non-specific endonuclease [Oceanispirochaeta sp.]
MDMKIIYKILFFLLPILQAFSQSMEIPVITHPDAVYQKSFYTLQYNERFEQADWVAYELTQEEIEGHVKRSNRFREDNEIKTGSAALSDYRYSGFDRGHLAPAADMKMSRDSMDDSFLMSNMSPQDPGFNRGIWAFLESCVRSWTSENESLFVVTGPVLTKQEYPVIGTNEVAVPESYYKVILDYREPDFKGIGFLLPNRKGEGRLQDYAVSIDEVEIFTGLDFYPLLPDDLEESLESVYDVTLWRFIEFTAD